MSDYESQGIVYKSSFKFSLPKDEYTVPAPRLETLRLFLRDLPMILSWNDWRMLRYYWRRFRTGTKMRGHIYNAGV